MSSRYTFKKRYGLLRLSQLFVTGRRPEIRVKDHFGASLRQVIRQFRPKTILETGAWDGRGSTTCILSALDYEPKSIDCVEANPEKASVIQRTIQHLYPFVSVHVTSSLAYKDWSFADFEGDLLPRLPQDLDRLTYRRYWEQESSFLRTQSAGFLSANPQKKWDLVLLDGGELCGFDEFRLLEGRFQIIALDDVFSAFKGRYAYEALLRNSNFELLAASRYCRRGFAIFKNKAL